MEHFENYAEKNSFEISLLLTLSHEEEVPSKVKQTWFRRFDALSKSIKIHSLKRILNQPQITKTLFNSCTEYKTYSHFIEENVIPLIINYEMTNDDLLTEIIHLYQQRIQYHTKNTKSSIFNTFGWLQFVLFLLLNISDILSIILPTYFIKYQIFQTCIALALFVITSLHLYLAVKTFNKRRIFCYYLQSLSPHINNISHRYTPFILEGFNIYDLSLFHNADYNQTLKLIPPHRIHTSKIMLISCKYIALILYALCMMHYYIGLLAVFISPIIVGTLSNLESIYRDLYESSYEEILGLYSNSVESCHQYESIAPDDAQKTEITQSRVAIDAIRNKDGKIKYWCRLNGYLFGYSLIMLCIWPILLLTPFIFGFCIMCSIDPGLDNNWSMRQFCRYWAAFMSIKVVLGMTLVIICDLCWGTMSRTAATNHDIISNEDGELNNNETEYNYDAYNTMSFSAMNVISIAVIVALIFGVDSWETQVFRVITWLVLYIWISAAAIRQIVPRTQRVMNWKATFKMHKWLNSNLLQTKL